MRTWIKPQSEWALQPCSLEGMSGVFMLGPVDDTKEAENRMQIKHYIRILGIGQQEVGK